MVDLLQIILNVTSYLPSLEVMLQVISWLIGLGLVIAAVRSSAQRSEMGKSGGSWTTPAVTFVVGVCFIALPGLMAGLTQTFFAQETPDASSIFEYAPATVGMMEDGGAAQTMIRGITSIVMFVGVIAVMRGLFLLRQATQGNGPSTFGPGATFVIAGIMAVNFPLFIGAIEMAIVATRN